MRIDITNAEARQTLDVYKTKHFACRSHDRLRQHFKCRKQVTAILKISKRDFANDEGMHKNQACIEKIGEMPISQT